jgi:hypothetical protein
MKNFLVDGGAPISVSAQQGEIEQPQACKSKGDVRLTVAASKSAAGVRGPF